MSTRALLVASVIAISVAPPSADSQVIGAQFDVVSIKPHRSDMAPGGGIETRPDGTFIMTNQPISTIMLSASPVQVREVAGLPDWAERDAYDIVAKPPAGATRAQRAEMMRNMFIERMKL